MKEGASFHKGLRILQGKTCQIFMKEGASLLARLGILLKEGAIGFFLEAQYHLLLQVCKFFSESAVCNHQNNQNLYNIEG